MSYAAVDSEVLFCCVVALAVLLVVFTGVVITTPPRTAGAPQPPELSSSAPPPAGYRPRHACPRSGSRGGAHRQAPRHGTHRVRMSTGQVRGPAGRPGIARKRTERSWARGPPQHHFADLGGHHDRQGHGGADQPLPDVERNGLHHGVEDVQDGGKDQQDEGPAGRDDERLVGEGVERTPSPAGLSTRSRRTGGTART